MQMHVIHEHFQNGNIEELDTSIFELYQFVTSDLILEENTHIDYPPEFASMMANIILNPDCSAIVRYPLTILNHISQEKPEFIQPIWETGIGSILLSIIGTSLDSNIVLEAYQFINRCIKAHITQAIQTFPLNIVLESLCAVERPKPSKMLSQWVSLCKTLIQYSNGDTISSMISLLQSLLDSPSGYSGEFVASALKLLSCLIRHFPAADYTSWFNWLMKKLTEDDQSIMPAILNIITKLAKNQIFIPSFTAEFMIDLLNTSPTRHVLSKLFLAGRLYSFQNFGSFLTKMNYFLEIVRSSRFALQLASVPFVTGILMQSNAADLSILLQTDILGFVIIGLQAGDDLTKEMVIDCMLSIVQKVGPNVACEQFSQFISLDELHDITFDDEEIGDEKLEQLINGLNIE